MSIVTTPSACIQAEKDQVAKVVLMPGDPLRAKFIAETYLENPVLFNSVRNMYGYTGTYKGKQISVMGSGMGIPSISIYAHELYAFFDVDAIIRVGSAGALQDDINLRDVVIAMGASTNSSFADQFNYQGTLCATADYQMLADAVAAAKEIGANAKVGNAYTTDIFYNANSETAGKSRELGMLCQEMETAGLYMEAARSHKKALSILSISDHMFKGGFLTPDEIRDSFHEMMEIALETAWKTIK